MQKRKHQIKWFGYKVLGYMNPDDERLIINAFFSPQFAYCPLAQLFKSTELKHKVNRLHGRC